VTVLLLALWAALYPTLLAVVVILLSQPRPRRLIGAYLAGGLTISISLGLIIVFALKESKAVTGERSAPSWGADLAVGVLALLLAAVLATRSDERVRHRTKRPPPSNEPPSSKEPWSQRIMSRGSVPVVFGAALAINLPGAAYLIALKDIAAGGHGPVAEVALVVGFNLIMFALAEVPLLGLWLAPERNHDLVHRVNRWLSAHGRDIATALSAVLGIYLTARGIVNA
jgi:hypothetical protein